ncbi:aminotransferase class IV [Planctomicrobium sp. SH527]|uniref:aminotransferase class IV n=1 Tax=Planctomicrobium sp. SH527 TaxID=3448123 RepID=UPI003F5B760D
MDESVQQALANWNGVEMPLLDVRVSVLDRGFLFGDAIYEVIRVYRGRPFLFQDHIDRIGRNLKKLQIHSDKSVMAERALKTLAQCGHQEATIYFQITRGEAKRTHTFPSSAVSPNELVYVQEFRDPYVAKRENGGTAILIPDIRWKRCDIKSTNLLANCLGAEQAKAAGCDEAIFMDPDGVLIEGTHTSLFAVRDGAIQTTPLGLHILPGITRKLIFRLAQSQNIPIIEGQLHRDDLSSIDELFITGTSTELMPIIQVDDIVIGNANKGNRLSQPGPIVKQLQKAYREAIQAECP